MTRVRPHCDGTGLCRELRYGVVVHTRENSVKCGHKNSWGQPRYCARRYNEGRTHTHLEIVRLMAYSRLIVKFVIARISFFAISLPKMFWFSLALGQGLAMR